MSVPAEAPQVTDTALSQRLERAEAKASAAYVESRALAAPSLGAEWRDFDGTYAMFDGVGSPLSQTFGFGLFSSPTGAQLEAIESFFQDRGAEVFHEVSPLADPSVLGLMADRGYHPVELTSVMHLRLTSGRAMPQRQTAPALVVARVEAGSEDTWAETASRGWSDTPEAAAFIRDFGTVSARARGTVCFIARWEGHPIAAAAIAMHDGVALLAGASTDPSFRGRGAQAALLDTRLAYATSMGCELAMMGALPGSASQRNGERQGFRIAYTRIKWQLHHVSSRA
ncbi:MAG TPA: GNAT family N-acetyltransferase [Gemmatimonadaceae bacterium]|nr:GNAT family N-acetyltransferase [Gemmatimonadaceae bacterium]